jgi:hypothetical protein
MKHARMAAEATIPDVLDRKQRNHYNILQIPLFYVLFRIVKK